MNATKAEPQIGDARSMTIEAVLASECLDEFCGALNLQTNDDGSCIECGGLLHKVWAFRDEDREIDVKIAEVISG